MRSENLCVFALVANIGWLDNGLDLFDGCFCTIASSCERFFFLREVLLNKVLCFVSNK